MSQNKNIIKEIIEYIETSVHEGLDESEFIKNFRKKIEKILEEKLL